MKRKENVRIVLVGAGGMSFGPVMVLDAVRAEKIRGSTLVLMDINEERLEVCYAAACRVNRSMGNPIKLEMTTDIRRALKGAHFVLLSTENKRFEFWGQDYEVPRKHGSRQLMGENGGPGGIFHAMRSIKLIISICRNIEKYSPNAFVLNLTNPMNPVTLAINRHTSLKTVGLCHELYGGLLRVSSFLMIPKKKIIGEAHGMNHFTWFYRIEHKDTGEDLYPRLRRHLRLFPLLYPPLVRYTFLKYGVFPTSTDSHIGEYLPYAHKVNRWNFPFHEFFHREWELRNFLTNSYANRRFTLPVHLLPESGELPFPIIEGMVTGESTYLGNVVVPNKGYIPNLPKGVMVEVAANTVGKKIKPIVTPPLPEPLAEIIKTQSEIQSMVVDAAVNGDKKLAFQAMLKEPLTPNPSAARKIFDELYKLQCDYLPF